jgi:hypothetical protein
MLASVNTNAQIVYNDIPDTNINYPIIEYMGDGTVIYNIDLNNDSINDFCFKLRTWQTWQSPSSQPIHHVSIISGISQENRPSSDEYPCVNIFLENDSIDMNCGWLTDSNDACILVDALGYTAGCDIPYQDKYFGVKFNIDGNTHYGWIQLDGKGWGEVLLKGYVYNTIPDQFITAGQKESSSMIYGQQDNKFIISYANKKILIKQTSTMLLFNKVLVFSLSGIAVFECNINDYQATLNLHNVKSGIYIIRVVSDNYVYSKLLYIN